MGNKSKNKKPRKHSTSSKTTKISMETKLNRIYNKVDLRTTCCNKTSCCKVSMPAMNYSEFVSLINQLWKTTSKSEKIEMICKSVEYFFHNEFEKFKMLTMLKPCMLLATDGKCSCYEFRPLSCRMYGLWPTDVYTRRVDRFEKAYEGLLKREELPLNTQCPNVKRLDESVPLTEKLIDSLYKKLDDLDAKMLDMHGSVVFTNSQIENKENYRTFHDFLLWRVFGEDWLVNLTSFMKAANKDIIDEQIEAFKIAISQKFAKDMPDLEL